MANKKSGILLGLFCAFLLSVGAPTASAQSCPSGALPGSMCGSGTLTNGSTACVGPFLSNGTSIEMNGQTTGASPRWTIHWMQTNPGTSTKLYKANAIGVTADIINNSSIIDPLTGQPESTYFPGYFSSCVFNDTGVTLTYLISIGPGQF